MDARVREEFRQTPDQGNGPRDMAPALRDVALDDKFLAPSGRVFLTGTQALVRLMLAQRRRDREAGLNTGGLVSGYRGSPLGAVDLEMERAARLLKPEGIEFQPGVNEDLAATALWGSQQVGLFPGAKVDGVFGLWYGKGPGVDRSGDVFKHANNAGTAPFGGVLAVAGDDHACKSSTAAHQSDFAFMDAQMPVLHPANVQEILDYGLMGWALSRYSGLWVGLKTIADTVESSAVVDVSAERIQPRLPEDFVLPEGGLNIRWPDPALEQERRLHAFKIKAAQAFVRANRLDRVVLGESRARFGLVATGKAYLDLRQALELLGLDEAGAAALGIAIYKVAMPWPLEPEGITAFAHGKAALLVVEEKRALIESQIKERLYGRDNAPRLWGKTDAEGQRLLPSEGALSALLVARALLRFLKAFGADEAALAPLAARLAALDAGLPAAEASTIKRIPYFCSGCPHNTSTRVPEGSRALGGIGCHYMALWMDRDNDTFTQMGGEGASWIGQAPFTATPHVFQNLGDGTYLHSGLLAIRAAIAAKVNITYKILFNDAVAMTGGQRLDNAFDVPTLTRQLAAEGIRRIVIVADDPDKYPDEADFAPGVTREPRVRLDAVQRMLRETPGVTALIYDQTCAAEKRRRRKRKLMADIPKRVFINERVCEGCGDCGVQSNCVSILPVETPWGRKRAIDQSACNKDFSCLAGFCPAMVTVESDDSNASDLRPRRKAPASAAVSAEPALPEPPLPALTDEPYNILITGIGGTGVVTIGALLGMAAHLEGKAVNVMDMAGMAQKNGAVLSHVRLAKTPEAIFSPGIAEGQADLLLGCDLVVAGGVEARTRLSPRRSRAVINSHDVMTADFTHKPDLVLPDAALHETVLAASRPGEALFVEATRLAETLLGDSIAANPFLLGFAWQKGWVPLNRQALEQAIRLNGVAVDNNLAAFRWGRRAACDLEGVVQDALGTPSETRSESLDELLNRCADDLVAYQNARLAARFLALAERVRKAEDAFGAHGLTEAAARSYHKLLAIKDEYEVARLYTDGAFERALGQAFEGKPRPTFHLSPPLLSRPDPISGRPPKRRFGPWMATAMKALAGLKGLRGTPFDPFGYQEERRAERALIRDFETTMAEVLAGLTPANHALAVELAALPQNIRGFGPVKRRAMDEAATRRADLLSRFRQG